MMNHRRRKLAIGSAMAVVLVVSAAGLSRPGHRVLIEAATALHLSNPKSGKPPAAPAATAVSTTQDAGDTEQKARAAHGWSQAVADSTVRGSINFFDRSGQVSLQQSVAVYRKYPDRLRVELKGGGADATIGFDGKASWRAGAQTITEDEARNVRGWLRATPERLFVTRDHGHPYTEMGPKREDIQPGAPGTRAVIPQHPTLFSRVAILDTLIAPVPGHPEQTSDQRRLFYLVNTADWIENAIEWMEPDDPRSALDDRTADRMSLRVDFGNWQKVNNVLWPFLVAHWVGGRADYEFTVSQVQMSQNLPDTLFQNPNK